MNNGQNIFYSYCASVDKISDEKLYELSKQYGERARMWKQKFAGLLPEVFRRGLYQKKGFSSIFEFAAKLAGMSKEQAARVLNLHENFEDKPVLKNLLVNGEVSVNKLARIASIATPQNQEFLANQVRILPKNAIETLVRDEKSAMKMELIENQDGLFNLENNDKFVPGHKFESENQQKILQTGSQENFLLVPEKFGGIETHELPRLKLSREVIQKLLELQNKGIDINELLLEFLQKRELEIAQEKEQISTEIQQGHRATQKHQQTRNPGVMCGKRESSRANKQPPKPSRSIPVKIKKIIHKEHGSKCSIQACNKPAQTIHHTQRFALSHTHNPQYLAPLCREHHVIAHSIDIRFYEKRHR